MLAQRVVTAIVMLVVCLSALWFAPPWLWTLGVAVVFMTGAIEWSRLTGLAGAASVGLALSVGASTAALLAGLPIAWVVVGWAATGLAWSVALPLMMVRGSPVRAAALPVGWVVLGPSALALAWLGGMPGLLLSLLAIVWIADSAAYFAGRRFGRHKLAPSISPGKTWEGVAGALVAVAAYVALLQLTGIADDGPLAGAAGWLLALAMTALSVVGDLFESLVKRQAGAKDSGDLLPGHGGVLDRIDGLTSTLPVAALAVYLSRG